VAPPPLIYLAPLLSGPLLGGLLLNRLPPLPAHGLRALGGEQPHGRFIVSRTL
jgi:hypothetical protein